MSYKLPPQKKKNWTQTNNGDLFGSLKQTCNIDLDEPGLLKLAKRARSIYDDTIDADFGNVLAIERYTTGSDRYYIATSEKLFYMDASTMVLTEDATSGFPTMASQTDLLAWNDLLYVSGASDLNTWNGSAWSVADSSASDGPMCIFKNKNSLCLGQDNTVRLYSTSNVVTETLTLPEEFKVTSLDWSGNYVYVGTRHKDSGEAMLFVWDGNTSAANFGYPVGTHRIDSVKAYKSTVVLITSDGQLLAFNGAGLNVLANLPNYYTDRDWDTSGAGDNSSGRVIHRGMAVESELIFIRLSSVYNVSTDDDVSPDRFNDYPSGVWCYDPLVGLYHRYGVSGSLRLKTDPVSAANINTTTNVITVAGATVPATGTPVMYDDGNDGVGTAITISGGSLKFRQRYYTIYQSNTTLKLAETYADALAGTAIDITGTGNNAQYFLFFPNRDFGGAQNSGTGAIILLKKGSGAGFVRTDALRLMFGGNPGTTTTTSIPALNVVAEGQENRGNFITPWLQSASINDNWQNITIKFRNIVTPEDKILVKYRTAKRYDKLKGIGPGFLQTATWVDSDSFTTTDVNFALAQVGDEVEFVRGSGAGYRMHISSISEISGTYTVNLDESVQNVSASDTCLYFVDNWDRLRTSTDSIYIGTADCQPFTNSQSQTFTSTGGEVTFPINKQTREIQFNIELRGEDVQIEEMLVNGVPFHTFVA